MIDTALITVRSGKGGDGSFSYRREKYIPKGGPDGGDGGNGGSVYLVANEQRNTLRDFQGKTRYEAQSGQGGQKRQMFGADAPDLEVAVPVGTVVWQVTNAAAVEQGAEPEKEYVGEILTGQDRLLVARGGLGGRGNVHFKSAANRTPLEHEIGGEPQEKTLFLELKLLADVGLVGFPNAGKSTFLSVVTEAQPKIANYPFTTLSPNLGVLSIREDGATGRYVLADIPGLVEEASQGKGLGHQFLRHIERCRLLLYVLYPEDDAVMESELSPEALAERIASQWHILQTELAEYNAELATRPRLVSVNKIDLLSQEQQEAIRVRLQPELKPGESLHFFSAATTRGVEDLTLALFRTLQTLPKELPLNDEQQSKRQPVYGPAFQANKPTIVRREFVS